MVINLAVLTRDGFNRPVGLRSADEIAISSEERVAGTREVMATSDTSSWLALNASEETTRAGRC